MRPKFCSLRPAVFCSQASHIAHTRSDKKSKVAKAMATAADYRKWAEECFEWAREAHDDSVRQQYANLGQVWLECAVRAELRPGVITPPETTADKVA
jgi:hypothetical protein